MLSLHLKRIQQTTKPCMFPITVHNKIFVRCCACGFHLMWKLWWYGGVYSCVSLFTQSIGCDFNEQKFPALITILQEGTDPVRNANAHSRFERVCACARVKLSAKKTD